MNIRWMDISTLIWAWARRLLATVGPTVFLTCDAQAKFLSERDRGTNLIPGDDRFTGFGCHTLESAGPRPACDLLGRLMEAPGTSLSDIDPDRRRLPGVRHQPGPHDRLRPDRS